MIKSALHCFIRKHPEGRYLQHTGIHLLDRKNDGNRQLLSKSWKN